MKNKYVDLDYILKTTTFYQTLLQDNIKHNYIKFKNKIILYTYTPNNIIKHTYFINFKELSNYRCKVTIMKDNRYYDEEECFSNMFDREKAKVLLKKKSRSR